MPGPHEDSSTRDSVIATGGSKESTCLSTTKAHIILNDDDAGYEPDDASSSKTQSISGSILSHLSIPQNDRLGWRVYNNRFRNPRSPLPERRLSRQELTPDPDDFATCSDQCCEEPELNGRGSSGKEPREEFEKESEMKFDDIDNLSPSPAGPGLLDHALEDGVITQLREARFVMSSAIHALETRAAARSLRKKRLDSLLALVHRAAREDHQRTCASLIHLQKKGYLTSEDVDRLLNEQANDTLKEVERNVVQLIEAEKGLDVEEKPETVDLPILAYRSSAVWVSE